MVVQERVGRNHAQAPVQLLPRVGPAVVYLVNLGEAELEPGVQVGDDLPHGHGRLETVDGHLVAGQVEGRGEEATRLEEEGQALGYLVKVRRLDVLVTVLVPRAAARFTP